MPENTCPNYGSCNLVKDSLPPLSPFEKQRYIDDFCEAGRDKWGYCRRYLCKKELSFCPDFVLPDSKLTNDQIIDQFDNV